MTFKEMGKRVIEILSSNKGATIPNEFTDWLDDLG